MSTKTAVKDNKELTHAPKIHRAALVHGKAGTVTAVARYVHISARKTRLVADLIRGKPIGEAVMYLQHLKKRAAQPVLKLLLSAVANAEHNNRLDKDTLKISRITVDGGPAIKRWQPRAYGRASEIKRPTSHITISLESVVQKKKGDKKFSFPVIRRRAKKEKAETSDAKREQNPDVPKNEGKEEKGPKLKGVFGIKKNLFNRKGGEK